MSFLSSHGGLFCFPLIESGREPNIFESHPTYAAYHGSSEGFSRFGNPAFVKGAPPWCWSVLCVLVVSCLEHCRVVLSRALLPISRLLILGHIWKWLQGKGLLFEASVWSWKEMFLFIVWNTFLIYSNFIQTLRRVDGCTCGTLVSFIATEMIFSPLGCVCVGIGSSESLRWEERRRVCLLSYTFWRPENTCILILFIYQVFDKE